MASPHLQIPPPPSSFPPYSSASAAGSSSHLPQGQQGQQGQVQWQDQLLVLLRQRNAREGAYAEMIEQYRRLAEHTRVLRERNTTLLRAVNTARASGAAGDENAIRTALIQSLESQISRLRDELSEAYKKHGQNAQRLLELHETSRLTSDQLRSTSEDLRRTREELARVQRELEAARLNVREKERFIQELSDDNTALSLELTQTAARNDSLKRDNASLLQRWLDAKNEEVQRMNEANGFWEEMQSQVQRARVGSPSNSNSNSNSLPSDLPASPGKNGLQPPPEIAEPGGSGAAGRSNAGTGGSTRGGNGGPLPGFRKPPTSPGQTRRTTSTKEGG